MEYGYARVSSGSQKKDVQIKKLKDYGVDKIISETVTGISKNKKLDKLIEKMEEGDCLICTRVDRLGRSTLQLLQLMNELEERKIALIFVDQNVDTSTAMGKLFIQNLAVYAEFERNLTKEKVAAGIELAKQKGKFKGKPIIFKKDSDKVQLAFKMYDSSDYTVAQICKSLGFSRATFYRRLKEREESK